jgi:beta propeller repeat protein
MGRLNFKFFTKQVRIWILPFCLALLLVGGYHTIFANPEPTIDELAAYLQNNSLSVGDEIVGGYQQIFYVVDDRKVFITSGGENNRDVIASGEYVAWVREVNGVGQIMLHNVLTKATLQLSGEGSNVNPVISSNKVVWEKWMNNGWQIFYYDGISVSQLSRDYVSVRPQIQDNQIVYAQKLPGNNDDWQVVGHDLRTNNANIITTGDETNAWPHFKGDTIETKYDPTL